MSAASGFAAFISGCEGLALTERERDFFREARPCGLILFKRNCGDAEQVRRLVGDFHEATGGGALVLIDQEGGRVQRLAPPNWPRYPAGRSFGQFYRQDANNGREAAWLCARLIAHSLAELGITVNCAPVLDIPIAGAHDVIGDRAYGDTAEMVSALGRAVAEGYLAGGVLPVIKHIPGHGRAKADSHASLPVIEASHAELSATDFLPFRALRDMPLGMTAHILIPAIDPERPSSASPEIIQGVIRGEIGFGGFLMCDDLGMGALAGGMAERTRAVLAAGCDAALHCSGVFAEMEQVAAVAPRLSGEAASRFEAARARLAPAVPFDMARAEALIADARAYA